MKRAKKQAEAQPRSMDEINKEYSELIGKVGQAQYKAYVYQRATEELNRRLELVNTEADARGKLDAEAKKQSETVEVKNA